MEANLNVVLGEHVEQEPSMFTVIKTWHNTALCVVQKKSAVFYLEASC